MSFSFSVEEVTSSLVRIAPSTAGQAGELDIDLPDDVVMFVDEPRSPSLFAFQFLHHIRRTLTDQVLLTGSVLRCILDDPYGDYYLWGTLVIESKDGEP
ncbi:hypothetical protein ACFL41_00275 [Gemmatimonadota bacterium]